MSESVLLQASDGATARIYTQGAHISSWIPSGGKEQLFLSSITGRGEGLAIRGGIPVIFPQFAALGPLPKHGFARTAQWRLLRSGQIKQADLVQAGAAQAGAVQAGAGQVGAAQVGAVQAGAVQAGAAQAVFELKENIASLLIWPFVFRAELVVTISGDTLHVELTVINSGDTSFNFTCALHTYLAVRQIDAVRLKGLAGLRYRDCVSGAVDCLEPAGLMHIEGEIDRIYANATAPLELRQSDQTTYIGQTGFSDAVIWNPGAEKGSELGDLEPGGFARMLCVEAAAVMQATHLAPGASWSGAQILRVVAL